MIENFPPLHVMPRDRALREVGEKNVWKVLYYYLIKGVSYRKIDADKLKFQKNTNGWESMGVMRHFGFTYEHKSIFYGVSIEEIIDTLTYKVPDVIDYIPNVFMRSYQNINNFLQVDINHMKINEGKGKFVLHLIRERNPKIINEAKAIFKKTHHGHLYCEICGFDFAKVYGERGDGFIEGHHKYPISQMKSDDTTSIDDIVLVCSNCHSMLHRTPFLSVDDLKLLLSRKASKDSY